VVPNVSKGCSAFRGQLGHEQLFLETTVQKKGKKIVINQSIEHVATANSRLLWCCALPLRQNL